MWRPCRQNAVLAARLPRLEARVRLCLPRRRGLVIDVREVAKAGDLQAVFAVGAPLAECDLEGVGSSTAKQAEAEVPTW